MNDDDDVVSHANLHSIIPPKIYTSCMYLPYTINNAIYHITFSILYLPTEMWTYVKFRVDKLNRLDKISSYNVCIHVHTYVYICLYIIYTELVVHRVYIVHPIFGMSSGCMT